jgi:hypothetical protein
MLRTVAVTLALAALVTPSAALAQTTPAAPAPAAAAADSRAVASLDDELPFPRSAQPVDAPPKKRWYGWQMILGDAVIASVSFRLMSELDATDDSARWGLILTTLVAMPAVVHGLNGHGDRALSSILIRFAPFVGAMVAFMIYPPQGISVDDDNEGGRGAVLVGWILGLGYTAYYVWELGFHTTHVEEPPETPRWGIGVAPTSDGGAVFGLGGSF